MGSMNWESFWDRGIDGIDELGIVLVGIDRCDIALIIVNHGVQVTQNLIHMIGDLGGKLGIILIKRLQHIVVNSAIDNEFFAQHAVIHRNGIAFRDGKLKRGIEIREIKLFTVNLPWQITELDVIRLGLISHQRDPSESIALAENGALVSQL